MEEKYERLGQHDENQWNGIRQIVIYEGLMRKFSQNQDLKEKLKATGNTILTECAVKDGIWGIGLSMKDPDRLDRSKWKGIIRNGSAYSSGYICRRCANSRKRMGG